MRRKRPPQFAIVWVAQAAESKDGRKGKRKKRKGRKRRRRRKKGKDKGDGEIRKERRRNRPHQSYPPIRKIGHRKPITPLLLPSFLLCALLYGATPVRPPHLPIPCGWRPRPPGFHVEEPSTRTRSLVGVVP
jgi:hypothetical protein